MDGSGNRGDHQYFFYSDHKGNKMLAKIHNNPKLEGPRMPLILPEELEDKWLNPIEDELDVKSVQELIKEYPDEELDAYTVR